MTSATVHVAVYDTWADWEVGYASAHIRNGRWQTAPGAFDVRTVGASLDPVMTMGGLRIVPDTTLDEIGPANSAMLVLAGNDIWPTAAFAPFAAKAAQFLAAGTPVAAICGATGGLARAGLLDERDHTSNAREFLESTGYAGGDRYRDVPAVTDGPLITASGVRPVEFAVEIFAALGIYAPGTLESWRRLYADHDPAGYYGLVQAG